MVEVNGHCTDGFGAVSDAFVANFDAGLELGASVCVTVGGEPVVDLWAGDANEHGDPWERDTIVNVYSTTKTMATTCMLMLADRGQLDFDAPVAKYWPEFAQNGKEGVLVKHVMAHSAGLSGIDEPLEPMDVCDFDKIVGLLEKQAPWWDPGTQAGYHALTQGHLQAEILRRITGETMNDFFVREVTGPLGADFHLSLDASHDDRVGDLIPPDDPFGDARGVDPSSVAYRTLLNPQLTALEPRTREWRAALIPAAGGIGNARSVGRVHSALACGGTVDGVTLMSPETVESILVEQNSGPDLVLLQDTRFGMGFGLGNEMLPIPPRAFFWGGWGGSLALIDLDARLTVSYVMNRMAPSLSGDVRGAGLALAAYGALMG